MISTFQRKIITSHDQRSKCNLEFSFTNRAWTNLTLANQTEREKERKLRPQLLVSRHFFLALSISLCLSLSFSNGKKEFHPLVGLLELRM